MYHIAKDTIQIAITVKYRKKCNRNQFQSKRFPNIKKKNNNSNLAQAIFRINWPEMETPKRMRSTEKKMMTWNSF